MIVDLYNCRLDSEYSIGEVILSSRERARLGALGFTKGARVCVKLRTRDGVIVQSRGARIAMSKKVCRRVVLYK